MKSNYVFTIVMQVRSILLVAVMAKLHSYTTMGLIILSIPMNAWLDGHTHLHTRERAQTSWVVFGAGYWLAWSLSISWYFEGSSDLWHSLWNPKHP